MRMRYASLALALVFAITFIWTTDVQAQPNTISIQGQLIRSDMSPVTGSRVYRLRFFQASNGDNQLGATVNGTVNVSPGGRFTIALVPPAELAGAPTPHYELAIDSALTPDSTIDPGDVFPERVKMHSVQYALDAKSIGGKTISEFVLAEDISTTSGVHAQGTFWRLDGNLGAIGGTHFIGTIDNQPFDLRANNIPAMRYVSPTTPTMSVNIVGNPGVNEINPDAVGVVIAGGGDGASTTTVNRAMGDYNTISGGLGNFAESNYSTIGGGSKNTSIAQGTVVAGGDQNSATRPFATVGGGYLNRATASNSTIGGGANNTASEQVATIGGGSSNNVGGTFSTIGGGALNSVLSSSSVIAGGESNTISNFNATIGGGLANSVTAPYSTVAGGRQNTAGGLSPFVGEGMYSFVGGGYLNSATSPTSTIAGGQENTASNESSAVGGGNNNTASGKESVIAGGFSNVASGAGSSVLGGQRNNASGDLSSIVGGNDNTVIAPSSFVGGGMLNNVSKDFSFIGAGQENSIEGTGDHSAIIGGWRNHIGSGSSFIGSGVTNQIMGNSGFSVIGGGEFNIIAKGDSFIGGGLHNEVYGEFASIVGGANNIAYGNTSIIIGGASNITTGTYATVLGGQENVAVGNHSIAAGRKARAMHQGSMVFADSQIGDFASTGANQFLIRAAGGVGINTNAPTEALTVGGGISLTSGGTTLIHHGNLTLQPFDFNTNRNDGLVIETGNGTDSSGIYMDPDKLVLFSPGDDGLLLVYDEDLLMGTPTPKLRLEGNGYLALNRTGASNPIHVGNDSSDGNGAHLTAGGVWTNGSDVNSKTGFEPVDNQAILDKIIAMPVTQWRYKGESEEISHIGPMAQDFKAAFSLGESERHIGTVDADGVSMAAIKALNERIEAKNARIAELEERLARLESLLIEGDRNE